MTVKNTDILVIRNDKIGDFILILPAISWIKKNIPQAKITCIVSKEVSPLAKHCKNIDNILVDTSIKELIKELNKLSFDISISFFSTFRIGYILKKINIPIRIAPKTKLAQFFYTHRILQKRSKSKKPEYEYNIDLVDEMFQIIQLKNIENIDGTPYLSLDYEESIKHRKSFIEKYKLNENKKIIFIHPSTGGSSKGLSIDLYANICKGLRKFDDYNFMIHTSKYDIKIAKRLIDEAKTDVSIKMIDTTDDLSEMVSNINICDIFMAGSTGPLHIAGALNKKTVAFYPKKKSSTSLRWETINDFKKRLSFSDINKSKKYITIEFKKTLLEIQKFIGSDDIV